MLDTDPRTVAVSAADALLARAVAVSALRAARLETAAADLALPVEGRLDDRTRAALSATIEAAIGHVERALKTGTARRLTAAGLEGTAQALLRAGDSASTRLTAARLLHPDMLEEWLCRCRLDLLARRLNDGAKDGEGRPSLLVRLSDVADRPVADAAHAMMVADSQRPETGPAAVAVGLCAERHHDLVWRVAATIDTAFDDDRAVFDRSLVQTAQDLIATYDEGARPEAMAMRLAIAIDARSEELPELLVEAIDDRRLTLFVAVLARSAGFDFADVRTLVLDPAGAPLWMLLKAQGLDRRAIARIGLALSEADPARDLNGLADDLDALDDVTGQAAAQALAEFSLPPALRSAREALRR